MLNYFIDKRAFCWSFQKRMAQILNVCTRTLLLCRFLIVGISTAALGNPVDGVVTGGSATIINTPAELQINQTSTRAVIEWKSFDIGAGEMTHFYQPGSHAIALNRVVNSTQLSAINGSLLGNGHVFVINPNGVLIGAGAHVDTAGFIASTADIANDTFMNSTGTYDFNIAGNQNASVKNRGHITVQDEGLVTLVAPTVHNSGVIEGNLARIHLGAGDTFGVDLYGDGLIHLAVATPQNANVRHILAENSGSIVTEGGKVLITAAAASDVVNAAINNSGVIEARSLINRNGQIILVGKGANVKVSGKINTSGTDAGGNITLKGHDITVAYTGYLVAEATGTGKGGHIELFGENDTSIDGIVKASGTDEGGNIEVRSSDITIGDKGYIVAEATGTGKGGHVDLFGGNSTSIDGVVKASGIDGGGNIEARGADITIGNKGYVVVEATSTGKGGHIDLFGVNNTRIDGTVKTSGIDGGGNIEARGDNISVNGYAVAEATNTGQGGHIDLVGGENTFINGVLKAGGKDGGGHIKVKGDEIDTGSAALLKTKDGSIRFIAGTLVDLAGGAFNADHFNIDSPTINFNGDTHVTNANLFLNTSTVNLNAIVFNSGNTPITDPLRFNSSAPIVNVLSDAALIQQGIYLADNGAVVTVSSGNYFGSFTIDRSLTLQGNGSIPALSVKIPQNAVATVAADHVTIKGFNIDGNGSAAGIRLTGNNDITIINNTLLNTDMGFDTATFSNGNITLSGNQFTNNAIGAQFGSGLIDLTGDANTFIGGSTAMLFRRATSGPQYASLALVDDTLGPTIFMGQTGLYVDLENGAYFAPGNPTLIDGTGATYDGISGSALTAGHLQTIEAKLHDFDDDSTLGQIFAGAAATSQAINLGSSLQINPLGRPVISVANRAIVYDPPFEPIETLALDTDVSIRIVPSVVREQSAAALAGLEPAAGSYENAYAKKKGKRTATTMNVQDLANIEPAAGSAAGNSAACANDFLDNRPCAVQ